MQSFKPVEVVAEIHAITIGLQSELETHLKGWQIVKEGRAKLTAFRTIDFKCVYMNVTPDGVYIGDSEMGCGPYPLNQPDMIEQVVNFIRSYSNETRQEIPLG